MEFFQKIFCFCKTQNDIQPIENNVFSDENLTKIERNKLPLMMNFYVQNVIKFPRY